MENERTELLTELLVLQTMAKENPCGMKSSLISSIANTVSGLFNNYLVNGASREEVARYFKVDVRTITRWKQQYDDFPKAGHHGHREISYSWKEIVAWKLKHKELDRLLTDTSKN